MNVLYTVQCTVYTDCILYVQYTVYTVCAVLQLFLHVKGLSFNWFDKDATVQGFY